jgi:hypothetical protein
MYEFLDKWNSIKEIIKDGLNTDKRFIQNVACSVFGVL